MSIYESVLELREKRLEMEDALQEIQKAVDELKKTHTRLLAQEKNIDKEQEALERCLESCYYRYAPLLYAPRPNVL